MIATTNISGAPHADTCRCDTCWMAWKAKHGFLTEDERAALSSNLDSIHHEPRDPRGFRWVVGLCVVFWVGLILTLARCT